MHTSSGTRVNFLKVWKDIKNTSTVTVDVVLKEADYEIVEKEEEFKWCRE